MANENTKEIPHTEEKEQYTDQRRRPGAMRTSRAGVRFIKEHEGSVIDSDGIHRIYEDQAGKLTIGYGHLIRPKELASGKFEGGLTEEEAEDLLAADLHIAEDVVNRLIKVPITQNQFDAMVSFAFNLGGGALKKLATVVNKRDWEGAAAKMALYHKVTDPKTGKKITSRGLLKRRKMEVALFKQEDPEIVRRQFEQG